MVFDTTSSNTGPNNGACARLEFYLDQKMLHFACRHHIYEIVLRATFELYMGGTSAPKVLLFERFQKFWDRIDQERFTRGVDEPEIAVLIANDEILNFALRRLEVMKFMYNIFSSFLI